MKLGTNNIDELYLESEEIDALYLGSDLLYEKVPYLCFTALEDTDIAFYVTGSGWSGYIIPTLQYRINGGLWTTYINGTQISLTTGQKIYWKGNQAYLCKGDTDYFYFESTGNVNASGSIMSLINNATTMTTYCFARLFEGCTTLKTAPLLPATTLANYCYYSMFNGCTGLVTAPILPATTLTYACYEDMFNGCTALTSATILAETLAEQSCYRMFQGCTSLVTPPTLHFTSLEAYSCCLMFSRSGLTTAPNLDVTELKSHCYDSMFYNCSSLTISDSGSTLWRVPTSGTFTNTTTYDQTSMFSGCLGTRSSDTMSGTQGTYHDYYIN